MTLIVESPSRDHPLDVLNLRPRKRDVALAAMLERAVEAGSLRDPACVLKLLLARERVAPAVLACGVAIPHARSILVEREQVILGRSERGVSWPGALEPVHLVMLVLSPGLAAWSVHERTVSRVAQAMRQARVRQRVATAPDAAAIRAALRDVFA